MQLAKQYDLTFYQGANFYYEFVYKDSAGTAIDLTGYTARMHIRTQISADATVIDISTVSGEIVIDEAAGKITINVPATDTESIELNHTEQEWVYDLELVDSSGFVQRILEGKVFAYPEVTRQ